MKDVFTKLQERCRAFERDDAVLVSAWQWDDQGAAVMVRITKTDMLDFFDQPKGPVEDWRYTMTCSFMVNGGAMCSVDVQDGTAEQVFEKMAMRMLTDDRRARCD